MKSPIKILLLLLFGASVLFAIPDVGADCPDFDLYQYSTEEDWNFYENHPIGKKVTVFISGSLC